MTTKPTLSAPSTTIDSLVAAGRKKFNQLFVGTDQTFDDVVWNIGHLQRRLTDSENLRLYFTHYQSRDIPLPSYYAQVVKSWLLLRDLSAKSRQECLDAARILWRILHKRRELQRGSFCWQSLCEEDLRQTELWMQGRFVSATIYRRISLLLQLAAFLEGRQICRPLFYTVQAPCPSKAVCTLAAQEKQRQKLPSKRALNGLAEVYASLAQTPQDRLRAAATALLVVTGFRVGELLALPVDCEVEEAHQGRLAYGLRYFKEKAKGAGKLYDIRWLTPLQAELAQQAIREIREITEPARQQAKILEENDPRVPIPGFAPTDRMSPTDIQHILGMPRRDFVYNTISRERLPRYGRSRAYFYLASEFETYLRSRRVKYLWTMDKG
ncbi:MAG: hypothetical protein R3264_21105, partial [Anaerolineae bacterium]|nr:hypothetical protein [Anaerolineae bacterium]